VYADMMEEDRSWNDVSLHIFFFLFCFVHVYIDSPSMR